MKFTENSVFSYGVVGALIGIATWATGWANQTAVNTRDIAEVRQELKEIREVKVDVNVVKIDLKRVLKKMGEE